LTSKAGFSVIFALFPCCLVLNLLAVAVAEKPQEIAKDHVHHGRIDLARDAATDLEKCLDG